MCPKRDGCNVEVRIYTAGRCIKGVAHWCRPRNRQDSQDFLKQVLWGITAGVFKYTTIGERFALSVDARGLVFEPGPDPFDVSLPGGASLLEGLSAFKWSSVRHVEEEP